jgi:hypothetical protein
MPAPGGCGRADTTEAAVTAPSAIVKAEPAGPIAELAARIRQRYLSTPNLTRRRHYDGYLHAAHRKPHVSRYRDQRLLVNPHSFAQSRKRIVSG